MNDHRVFGCWTSSLLGRTWLHTTDGWKVLRWTPSGYGDLYKRTAPTFWGLVRAPKVWMWPYNGGA